jgi:hypothetical protein
MMQERSIYRASSYILPLLLLTGVPSNGQNNILNNGGFESGLMCYTEWMWSYTGVNFAGDYHFSLSSDAHSGAYSFQISCGGSDCMKAAITSDYIPAPPNQSYLLSLYAKCPSGATATVYIPWTSTGGTTQYLNCNGNWNFNQVAFQTGSAPGDLYYYIFDYGTQFLRVDDVVLTFGNGTAPQRTVLHPGTRNARVSGQHLMVDGAPYLSLGFYNVPYNSLAQAAAVGAKTIVGGEYGEADCYNTGQKGYLDTAYDLGLNFLPDSTTTARLGVPGVFPTVTQTFAPHLANIAWVLADEPDLAAIPWIYVPPATFIGESAAAKLDTRLPMAADFQQAASGNLGAVSPYNGSADIWMAEPYGPNFGGVTNATQMLNTIQPRPIWLAQDDIAEGLIVPKAYWAIINGATGIHYYDWVTLQTEPTKLAAVQQAFGELKQLNNVIFGQPVDLMVTAPAGIGTMSRTDSTGTMYILSANPVAQNVTGTFLVAGLAAGQQVNVLFENRTITASARRFTDTFAGISRHVYVIQPVQTALTASIVSQAGSSTARDWNIAISNSGSGVANNVQISSISLTQTGGTPCGSVIAPGTFPVHLGNIAPQASASANVIIDFNACSSAATFAVKLQLSANSGVSPTVTLNNVHM